MDAPLHLMPSKIKLHRQSQELELHFGNAVFMLPAELLRVYSPSAEVKGHGPGQEVLQVGKRHVQITGIERAGNYALKLVFSDGHNSGIYTFAYLNDLGQNQSTHWSAYEDKLARAKQSRDPDTSVVKLML
jgi:DUF971 family protein